MHRVLVASLVLLAVACAVWAFRDPTVLALTLERLSPGLACALIALLATNELVKGARWAWYLRAARLPIRPLDGVTSYLAAQAASALPGGTILAARLAEEHGGGLVRLRHTTPALLVQGIGDLLAVSALASIGLALTDSSRVQFAVPVIGSLLGGLAIAAIRSEQVGIALVRLLGRKPLTRRILPAEEDARRTLLILCRLSALGPGVIASVLSSLIAVTLLVLLTDAMTLHGLTPAEGLYVHGMAMLAHLLLPVPSGVGTSELSLVGLLNVVGIGFGRATAIAVTYRALGLAFRTIVGSLVLFVRYHHLLVELRRHAPDPARSASTMDLVVEGRD